MHRRRQIQAIHQVQIDSWPRGQRDVAFRKGRYVHKGRMFMTPVRAPVANGLQHNVSSGDALIERLTMRRSPTMA